MLVLLTHWAGEEKNVFTRLACSTVALLLINSMYLLQVSGLIRICLPTLLYSEINLFPLAHLEMASSSSPPNIKQKSPERTPSSLPSVHSFLMQLKNTPALTTSHGLSAASLGIVHWEAITEHSLHWRCFCVVKLLCLQAIRQSLFCLCIQKALWAAKENDSHIECLM